VIWEMMVIGRFPEVRGRLRQSKEGKGNPGVPAVATLGKVGEGEIGKWLRERLYIDGAVCRWLLMSSGYESW